MILLVLGDFVALTFAIREACGALIENRDLLNQLDSGSGDGDCGSTLESGANGRSDIIITIIIAGWHVNCGWYIF